MNNLFNFSDESKKAIVEHIENIEKEHGHKLSICQLFESDTLYYIATDDDIELMPELLDNIDWSFTNRPLDPTFETKIK
jgi:hypothetical protein